MGVAGEPLAAGAIATAEDANFARFEEGRNTPMRRVQRTLHRHPTIVPFVVLALGVLAFSMIVGARFLAPFNLSLILQQVTIVGMIGIAQTLVILTAGVDLSVGAIMILITVVVGHLAVASGLPTAVAIVIGIAVGMGCGAVNGALVTFVRLPPFIVTLGTWSVYGAIFLWYSGSQTIRSQEVLARAPFLQLTGTVWSVLGARFTLGTLVTTVTTHSQAWIATTIITATVIGGTRLFGGRGSIVGTLVGAVIVGVFRNGLALAGLDALWQEFAVGLLIIVAVALDQWIRRVSA